MVDYLNWPRVRPHARVIIDNDYSGDPDDLIQTALTFSDFFAKLHLFAAFGQRS